MDANITTPEPGSYAYLDYITKQHENKKESINIKPKSDIEIIKGKLTTKKAVPTKEDDFVQQEKDRSKVFTGGLGSVFGELLK